MLKNKLATLLIYLVAVLITVTFICILADIIIHGFSQISWGYLTESPSDAGRAGGIAPIIVSTALIVFLAIIIAAPLGLATAILLTEFAQQKTIFAGFVERCLDVLASVPSIVFGLFGNAFFSLYLGLGFSILSGGLTLACMVLPILIRTAVEGLRATPDDYRFSAAALGITRTTALVHLLLPTAMPAIVAGLILGIGRAMAETAALIFTSGYVDRMPDSVFDSGRSLSIHIYDLSMNVAGGDSKAHAAALVLIVMLLIINAISMGLAKHWQKNRIISNEIII
ncbi:MAG: phosphate ABC transporter permease PstA [Methylococcales bacterium]|nr:phosphate ABC transporter permease PstA [Methylococcales bacterium]